VARCLAVLIVAVVGAGCAQPSPPPRSASSEVAPPAPPQVCYAREDTAPAAGDVATTDDPNRSVFVLDRDMLPELARRLDHPSALQKQSSLDKSIVQMVVRRHQDALRACYEGLVAKTPDKSGTVTARFAIAADGRVTRAHVTGSTLGAPDTEDCIGSSVCGWRFPALAAGHSLVLEYPFMLQPADPLTDADRK
jgi:hypothetical protein